MEYSFKTCPLKVGDKITMIERPSKFIIKEIKPKGIATQEVGLITWNELYLYFIKEDGGRCSL